MGRVKIDLPKAREIAHQKRRAKRDEEMAPHDEVIAKEIPGHDRTKVEAARQAIRDKHAQAQTAIDNAADAAGLKAVLSNLGAI